MADGSSWDNDFDPATRLAASLRSGRYPSDRDFDSLLEPALELRSYRHFSPVEACVRTARWLEGRGVRRVLDVGSGVGKVCILGALATELRFVGLERRPGLVRVATSLASRCGVAERATFVEGELDAVSLADFDAAYVYNPFAEHLLHAEERIDSSVPFGARRFARDLETLEGMLAAAPVGFVLVTYYRMGGRIDDTYDLLHTEVLATARLRLWQKRRRESAGHVWIETEDDHSATLVRRMETWTP